LIKKNATDGAHGAWASEARPTLPQGSRWLVQRGKSLVKHGNIAVLVVRLQMPALPGNRFLIYGFFSNSIALNLFGFYKLL
jgi:hypothetical protein